VKAGRLAAHARRAARCRALFGKVRFAKIMRTGLLPAALYAPEFSVYSDAELHALRVSVLVAEGLAAPGIAHHAAWSLLPAESDPAFIVHAAAVVRFGAEVWAVVSRADHPEAAPSDLLTPREIVAAADVATREPPDGPLRALAAALEWFGLELHAATSLRRHGEPWVDLTHCTPAMLRRALADVRDLAHQEWVNARHGADCDGLPPVNLAAARSVARRSTPAEARALAHLVGGTTRTFARAASHGAPCDARCPACGAPDTAGHRATECPAGGPLPAAPSGTRWTALGMPRWPSSAMPWPAGVDGLFCGVVAVAADGSRRLLRSEPPSFWPGRPIYTDGSGLHPATPFAVAAGAAVQAVPRDHWPAGCQSAHQVYAVAGMVVPPSAPATSYGGAVFGLLLAASRLATHDPMASGPDAAATPLVTDCLNAVRRLSAYRARPVAPSDPWGGPLRSIVRALGDRPWAVVKTAAHRAREDAERAGDLEAWSGNDLADWVAGRTLHEADAVHRDARASAARAFRAHRRLVRDIVGRLLRWRAALGVPPPVPRRVAEGRRAAAFALPADQRHAFRWAPERRRYRCEGCGRCVARLPRPGNRCLRAHPTLLRILAEAPRLGHCVHVCAVQGRMAGLLAICTRCGAYGAERAHRLRRPCEGPAAGRAAFLRAVSQGRHPVCRASVVERVWAVPPGGGAGPRPAGASRQAGHARPDPPPECPPDPGCDPPSVPGEEEDWSLADLLAWHGDDPA